MKLLLMLTAIFEAPVGVVMLIAPSLFFSTVLGVELDTPAGSIAGRIAGAAILSLAISCWQGRNAERGSASTGIVTAMLFYNFTVNTVLVYAGTAMGIQSPLLWPVIVIHAALAVWCLLVLWRTKRKLATE